MHRPSSYRYNGKSKISEVEAWCPNNKARQGEPTGDDDADRDVRASRKHICNRRRQELITSPPYRGYDAAARSRLARCRSVRLSSALWVYTSGKFAILIRRGRERRGWCNRTHNTGFKYSRPSSGMSRHFTFISRHGAQRDRAEKSFVRRASYLVGIPPETRLPSFRSNNAETLRDCFRRRDHESARGSKY